MDDDDYNFIYGLVDKLRENVLRKIATKARTENEIPFTARCNLDAVIRLLKLSYPRVDLGDTRTQSHIFLDPPVRSERITFTSSIDLTDDKKVKKSSKSKVFH